jgi:hypothetical protein
VLVRACVEQSSRRRTTGAHEDDATLEIASDWSLACDAAFTPLETSAIEAPAPEPQPVA